MAKKCPLGVLKHADWRGVRISDLIAALSRYWQKEDRCQCLKCIQMMHQWSVELTDHLNASKTTATGACRYGYDPEWGVDV